MDIKKKRYKEEEEEEVDDEKIWSLIQNHVRHELSEFAREQRLIIIIHSFYIALFSTLEQTQCTLVACDSKRAAVAFYGVF